MVKMLCQKILYAGCPGLSPVILVQPKIAKKHR